MTRQISGETIASRLNELLPDAVVDFNETDVWVRPESIAEVADALKNTADLDFAFLTSITAVDYIEYFEMVYHLLSMRRNASAIVKARVYGREAPSLPSLTGLWTGANMQEREVWDLMGVGFDGHPNMKRILLWEGFPGHPLRKDFLG